MTDDKITQIPTIAARSLIAEMDADEINELEDYASQVAQLVEDELDKLMPQVDDSDESRLFEAMRYSVFAGGKRVRPLLVVAANEMLGGQLKRAVRVAASVEVLHAYSLIHDDLPCMDDDDIRRGKPTVHKAFDEATAVLAGDALQTLCFEILADKETHPDPSIRVALIKLFTQSAGCHGMVGGQMIDIVSENKVKEDLDQGALARLQRKKTGALFSACCEAAVIINGATRSEHHRLSAYARNLGLAYQMMDDVLDVEGDAEIVGKATQKDADKGKVTFVDIMGVEGTRRQAEFLCTQGLDYLSAFAEKGYILSLLARFVATRKH